MKYWVMLDISLSFIAHIWPTSSCEWVLPSKHTRIWPLLITSTANTPFQVTFIFYLNYSSSFSLDCPAPLLPCPTRTHSSLYTITRMVSLKPVSAHVPPVLKSPQWPSLIDHDLHNNPPALTTAHRSGLTSWPSTTPPMPSSHSALLLIDGQPTLLCT